MIIWAVEVYPEVTEHEDLGQAIDKAEMFPYATLTKWLVEDNLPGLYPEKVWKSLRLYFWDSKDWWAQEIHGPRNAKWKERPDEA